ncbi:uncharacterized protein C8A04DRAFT_31314 [Dichotomopilus funicola]|uniref:Uncharacterized protein n=1 Tax=Dichotomopilus funicola TaxID=1934379 RepID=A0AAN6UXR1_9PEZI|nr:hypothetical protein C8A04DRAFT_31314 [Dichotomopilus funicola]
MDIRIPPLDISLHPIPPNIRRNPLVRLFALYLALYPSYFLTRIITRHLLPLLFPPDPNNNNNNNNNHPNHDHHTPQDWLSYRLERILYFPSWLPSLSGGEAAAAAPEVPEVPDIGSFAPLQAAIEARGRLPADHYYPYFPPESDSDSDSNPELEPQALGSSGRSSSSSLRRWRRRQRRGWTGRRVMRSLVYGWRELGVLCESLQGAFMVAMGLEDGDEVVGDEDLHWRGGGGQDAYEERGVRGGNGHVNGYVNGDENGLVE